MMRDQDGYARISSHKSSAVTPKRQRGVDRVEKILTAAAEIFAESGYEATTMSAIAVRSSTAVGSLYRFFPDKKALAIEVLERFAVAQRERLDALCMRDDTRDPAGLADALLADAFQPDRLRQAASMLIDIRDDASSYRAAFQAEFCAHLAPLLCRVASLGEETARYRAVMVLHLMKLAHPFSQRTDGQRVSEELRRALRRVIAP
ncbi:TetR/AcrR family transcriptional regulator [Neoasaia chiangmaiensis]|uniref:HTH tetR-type domain-containing protein n=1 Tax=Neoasaia chiangmaiensis TaxID=320497 RepID=A0A1U9KSR4_9PROT|nr:TetR/AcrR family transcriptional regulator [Neoasaia chiangmaiensis]AQS88769.1 hypothetical protein A0U93_13500 [Neoasaia chiangmaiensis]